MKDQFLFVYSLLVIHTQQVFYSHKKPTIREWIHLQLVGNILIVLTCIYILYTYYIHIIHIISIHPNTNSIHPNTNPSNSIHPIQSINIQTNSNQTNSIHQYPISNIQYPNTLWKIYTWYKSYSYFINCYIISSNIHSSIQFNSIQIPIHPTNPITK